MRQKLFISTKKSSGSEGLLYEFHQTLKEAIQIICKLFNKTEEGTILNVFDEVRGQYYPDIKKQADITRKKLQNIILNKILANKTQPCIIKILYHEQDMIYHRKAMLN